MSFSLAATTRRFFAPRHEISATVWLWRSLQRALRARGAGVRESGAFLLGTRDGASRHITAFVLYDDLDPHCLATGIVRFDGRHYGRLWRECESRKLDVVADVHTHPGGAWQSGADRDHPMIAQAGHVAFIIPDFARGSGSRHEIGVYRYRGDRSWEVIDNRTAFFHLGVL